MKKNNRIKLTTPALETREDVELAVNDLQLMTLNKIQMETEIAEQTSAIVVLYSKNLELTEKQIKTKTTLLKAWCDAHPEEFKERKSIEFPLGTIGYRTGMPKVVTVKKFTFKAALAAMQNHSFWSKFVHKAPTIDKELILAQHSAKKITSQALSVVGLDVDQDETFYVEPNVPATETRQVVKEAA